jgi:hypothetical protein
VAQHASRIIYVKDGLVTHNPVPLCIGEAK